MGIGGGVTDSSSLFEGQISVSGQIQQLDNHDNSNVSFAAIIFPRS
jgi:hypothetical protein